MIKRRQLLSAMAALPVVPLLGNIEFSVARDLTLTENTMTFNHKNGQYITSGDARLYVEEINNVQNAQADSHGDAPVLIMLHGGFGSIEDYRNITSALSKTHRLIGIDTRGHGASTLGTQPLTYELLANDLAHVIKTLGLAKYSIMGFSDGGTTALRYAAKQPQGLEKIITIGSGWELSESDPEWGMYSEVNAKVWKRMFPENYESYMALNPEADWDKFADHVIALWKNLSADNYPFESVKNIACESLIIRGDKDPLTNLNSMMGLVQLMPDMNYFNIPFAEHAAFDDQTDVFLNAVQPFLTMKHP